MLAVDLDQDAFDIVRMGKFKLQQVDAISNSCASWDHMTYFDDVLSKIMIVALK